MVPDASREAEVVADIRRAAQRMVDLLAAQAAPDGDVGALAELAGHELEQFARWLLQTLLAASEGAHDPDAASWVEHHYHESVADVGAALRDAIRVSAARHAVAQTLQAKVFEAEIELRDALRGERAS
jgi:hypothetical protein